MWYFLKQIVAQLIGLSFQILEENSLMFFKSCLCRTLHAILDHV